jgi:hypothetical protein
MWSIEFGGVSDIVAFFGARFGVSPRQRLIKRVALGRMVLFALQHRPPARFWQATAVCLTKTGFYFATD